MIGKKRMILRIRKGRYQEKRREMMREKGEENNWDRKKINDNVDITI